MASASSSSDSNKPGASKKVNAQEVLKGFKKLQVEQSVIAQKMQEIEAQRGEHRLVIETLKKANGDRRCYRMIGDSLVESKVEETLPILESKFSSLEKVLERLQSELVAKGSELNEYKQKWDIRIHGEVSAKDAPDTPASEAGGGDSAKGQDSQTNTNTSGVLVDRS